MEPAACGRPDVDESSGVAWTSLDGRRMATTGTRERGMNDPPRGHTATAHSYWLPPTLHRVRLDTGQLRTLRAPRRMLDCLVTVRYRVLSSSTTVQNHVRRDDLHARATPRQSARPLSPYNRLDAQHLQPSTFSSPHGIETTQAPLGCLEFIPFLARHICMSCPEAAPLHCESNTVRVAATDAMPMEFCRLVVCCRRVPRVPSLGEGGGLGCVSVFEHRYVCACESSSLWA